MFRIGEFARIGGVSAKMLRAWEALGLFRPVWTDSATGYRAYSPAQLPELRRIVALRDLGVPIAEITGLVAGGADLGEVLARRRATLEDERREVERRLRALDISMASAGDDVVVRPVAAEPVATIALDSDGDLGAAFYELEAYVRDLGRRAPRPPGALLPDAEGDPLVAFVPVRRPVEPSGRMGYRRLPACRVASTIHRGGYGGLDAAQAALEAWVAAAGLHESGPARVLYLQFGAEPELRVPAAYVVERDRDFVTELQVPIG